MMNHQGLKILTNPIDIHEELDWRGYGLKFDENGDLFMDVSVTGEPEKWRHVTAIDVREGNLVHIELTHKPGVW